MSFPLKANPVGYTKFYSNVTTAIFLVKGRIPDNFINENILVILASVSS